MRKFFAAALAAAMAATSLLGNASRAEVQKAPHNGSQMVKFCAGEKGTEEAKNSQRPPARALSSA